MSTFSLKLVISSLLLIVFIGGFSQDQSANDKHSSLKNMIDSKSYQFHANSATPMKGRSVQLTSEYYLKIHSDSLDVYLPYYGRAYSVDYGSTDQGVEIKTTQFDYTADTTKKGGWQVTIIPKDKSKASKIFLSISSTGYTTVNITSNTRQPISYYGTIEGSPN
jgi:Domain of unknown function (DUF4251)